MYVFKKLEQVNPAFTTYELLMYLSMAVHSSISFTMPFFTLIFGYLILRELLGLPEIINMILCFGGMLLIVFYQQTQNDLNEDKLSIGVDKFTYVLSLITALSQSILGGLSYVLLRKLKGVHFTITNGIYGVVLSIVSTIIWYFGRKMQHPELVYNFDGYQINLLIITGIFGNMTNQLIILALKYDKARALIIIACSSTSMLLKYISKEEE
ncbi:transmembrane protein 20 [Stylonychia lemnae]|uniref:Transmembrane protein 20 n=1 Tax=Stylonychia lemnae TaxID=5949 RepID=A0A078B9Z8_STYLE|nr:transmembrane protein 20 [Stylonychia lemnae]|eukprot:CDW91051.1 transmembrane protein 20 [Stylonychia lemnae]